MKKQEQQEDSEGKYFSERNVGQDMKTMREQLLCLRVDNDTAPYCMLHKTTNWSICFHACLYSIRLDGNWIKWGHTWLYVNLRIIFKYFYETRIDCNKNLRQSDRIIQTVSGAEMRFFWANLELETSKFYDRYFLSPISIDESYMSRSLRSRLYVEKIRAWISTLLGMSLETQVK